MMMKDSIRRFSTRSIIDKIFNILHSSSRNEMQMKLGQFIKTDLQQEETVYPNLINDMIHRWAVEEPNRNALWTDENMNDACPKLAFNDVHIQSSRLANVLTGKEFNLTPGKIVLVMLSNFTPERILLQLACLKSGLVFCPYDPKDLTDVGIPERIQKLAVDCIITNEDNLEIARKYTHNLLRPLKKGLITSYLTSTPLPVGWNHLIQRANNTESQFTKPIHSHPDAPVIRYLSNSNHVIQYSQKDFNLHLIITALWLSMNKTSRLIWMKDQNEINSIAPWFFGSSIFYKETENIQTIFNTFEKYPIDTFCAPLSKYQMIKNQQQENKTHLEQLFSTEPIDPTIKTQWHSLTNLHIRDDHADFKNKSMSKSFSNNIQPTIPRDE